MFASDLQCFAIVILAFVVIGFMRGWRRELITLVFVMLGVFVIQKDTSRAVGQFLSRIPATFGFLATGSTSQVSPVVPDNDAAPWWSLLIFAAWVALGWYIGQRAFPKPSTPTERLIGIVPAVVSGTFFVNYFTTNYVPMSATGQRQLVVPLPTAENGNIWPLIIFIAIAALVVAFITTRVRKLKK